MTELSVGFDRTPDEVEEDVAHAIDANGMEEFLARRDELTPEEIFQLGIRAGEAAARAAICGAIEPDAPIPAESRETVGPDPPEARVVNWQDVARFADEHGFSRSLVTRFYHGVRYYRLTRGVTDQIVYHAARLWIGDPEQPETVNDDGAYLDLQQARAMLGQMLAIGYQPEVRHASFRNVSIQTLNLLANYLNHTLKLDGDERLPVLVRQRQA